MNFIRVFPYKPSILGYLYFWKHPYIQILFFWYFFSRFFWFTFVFKGGFWYISPTLIRKLTNGYPKMMNTCISLKKYGHVWYPFKPWPCKRFLGWKTPWMILCQLRAWKDLSKQKGLGYDEQDEKRKTRARWFKRWPFYPLVGGRSVNLWKGHLTIPKRLPSELPGEFLSWRFGLRW